MTYNDLYEVAPSERGLFSLVAVYERGGNLLFRSVLRLKRANRCLLWLWKSQENVLVSWFILILKTAHLQQLKGMQSSKLGMWKVSHWSMEDIRKGFLCLSKIVHKRERGWTPGRSLRRIKLCLAPSPPPGLVLNVRDKRMITWQAFVLKRIAKKSHGSDILTKGRSAKQIATSFSVLFMRYSWEKRPALNT